MKNITTGIHGFTGGYNNNNASENSFVFGQNNETRKVNINRYCMVVGDRNKCSNLNARECIVLGESNDVQKSRQMKIIGDHNFIPNSSYSYGVLVGNRCAQTPALSNPIFTVACGNQWSAISKNGLEMNGTECKILNNLQLATDSTAVNAITPPHDPDFVSQDDQTLATVGYLNRFTPTDGAKVYAMGAADLPSSVVLPADGTPIAFANGGIYDDPPEWATRVQVTILWEGEYFTPTIVFDRTGGIHLDVKQTDTTMQPDLVIRHAHIRLDYQSATKTLQILDYWEYSHNITNNTISNIITGISNAAPVYIPRIDYLNG